MIRTIEELKNMFEDDVEAFSLINDSPYYFFSEKVLRKNWENLVNGFQANWINTKIAYSYKTNSLLGICKILNNFGAWSEVTSLHELSIAKLVHSKKIIFNGIYKTEEEMVQAIKSKAIINLDGWKQLETLIQVAKETDQDIEVGLRFTPSKEVNSDWDKFGFKSDTRTINTLLRKLSISSNIHVSGLHCHIGSNIKSLDTYFQLSLFLSSIWNYLCDKKSIKLKYLDFGGGFPSLLLATQFEKYSQAISSGLKQNNLDEGVELILEPGRCLVETSGILVARIIEVKEGRGKVLKYLILDAGVNVAMGVDLVGSRVILSMNTDKKLQKYDVFGPLCAQRDILSEGVVIPTVAEGDIVLIPNVGAYDVSTAYPFIRLRPPVYMKRLDNSIIQIRRQESSSDVFELESKWFIDATGE